MLYWQRQYASPCGRSTAGPCAGNGGNAVVSVPVKSLVAVVTRTHYGQSGMHERNRAPAREACVRGAEVRLQAELTARRREISTSSSGRTYQAADSVSPGLFAGSGVSSTSRHGIVQLHVPAARRGRRRPARGLVAFTPYSNITSPCCAAFGMRWIELTAATARGSRPTLRGYDLGAGSLRAVNYALGPEFPRRHVHGSERNRHLFLLAGIDDSLLLDSRCAGHHCEDGRAGACTGWGAATGCARRSRSSTQSLAGVWVHVE